MALGILAASVITGVVTILFSITSTPPPRKFDLIHWIGALLCIGSTSIFITGAFTAGKALKQANSSADVAVAVNSKVSNHIEGFLTGEISSQDSSNPVSSQIESIRDSLNRKFHRAIIWSIVITVALNLLYLLLLTTAGRVSKTVSTSDGFDDMDSDISNLGNFDSSIDDDFC